MSLQEIRYELRRMLLRYRTSRFIEAFFIAISAALIIYAALYKLTESLAAYAMAGTTFIVILAARIIQFRLFQLDEHNVMRYINRQFPELQESADLLLREPEELSMLEQLQQLRMAKQFDTLRGTVRMPHQLLLATLTLLAAGAVSLAISRFVDLPASRHKVQATEQVSKSASVSSLPASVKQLEITISPPSYTQLPAQHASSFPIAAPENSTVSWSIEFSAPLNKAALIFDGKDTVSLKDAATRYTATRELRSSGFYQLSWLTTAGQQKHSDFYPIQLRKDASPLVKIENLDQFIQLEPRPRMSVDMKATLTDDYGLTDAYIVATVSKGSGEGIKFREERLRFDTPTKVHGTGITATRNIDLIKLGLDPGDELYYYIEAFDTRMPLANRARTETYFITVKDTAAITTSVDPGLGVDLMPEYFRSQRQIIIDSEKLLKEKKSLTREQFNARSNSLAHDEKVLRLRYGEFLGEEFETSIGPSAGPDAPAATGDDIAKQYGHQHDTDEERSARVESRDKRQEESHSHSASGDLKDADPAKAYMHAHDSEDEATFFTQSIRARLKAAITIMWDAELHLRLYTPDKSLPYQYQALKLLKEISQDSRIYVHRTGFDPPPLKEEKRLSGELTDAHGSSSNIHAVATDAFPAIRRALQWLEADPGNRDITPTTRDLLLRAGSELSAVALKQPGRYLKALSLLRAYAENELPVADRAAARKTIRVACYQVLPTRAPHPAAQKQVTHPLDAEFLKQYDALPNELSQ
jgi:hypothetical protein